jgi:hypothetical protein
VPVCRADLPADVQAAFQRLATVLAPLQTTTAADGLVLELGARCLADAERLAALLDAEGMTFEAPTKYGPVLRARPEVAALGQVQRRLLMVLLQLGLTPASRNRVDTIGPLEATDPLERLLQRRELARGG